MAADPWSSTKPVSAPTVAVVAVSVLTFKYVGPVYDVVRVGKMIVAAAPVGLVLSRFESYPAIAVPAVYLLALLAYGGLLLLLRGVTVSELKRVLPGRFRRTIA